MPFTCVNDTGRLSSVGVAFGSFADSVRTGWTDGRDMMTTSDAGSGAANGYRAARIR